MIPLLLRAEEAHRGRRVCHGSAPKDGEEARPIQNSNVGDTTWFRNYASTGACCL